VEATVALLREPRTAGLLGFRRRGAAIVVDLDKIEGRSGGVRVLMLRATT
jgi:hypothetical protein